ncbi:MAG: polyphosphate polymerase domain-containing protein [Peptoanaerobacter stomatis]|uniref:polyphosphate polymerase domain-containing protein n=1 Tax=Peptoanaerobacter stomatis TaxID=796937 RepID=UPI003FA08228
MKNTNIFKRVEQKYLITKQEQKILLDAMKEHMQEDEHGRSTVISIYFDTQNNLLIRSSMQKPAYKEKLRIRSYGIATHDSKIFIELKKKYKSVVYKRRISMPEKEAMDYLINGNRPDKNSQILNEIDYFIKINEGITSKMYISCDREAYFDMEDDNFRITFDTNIMWRQDKLSLCKYPYGTQILKDGTVLMEMKSVNGLPLWMTDILTKNHIYKTSFSKYGNAYKMAKEIKDMKILTLKAS